MPAAARDGARALARYRPVDVADADERRRASSARGAGPVAAYLALPPGVFPAAVNALGRAGLPAGSRIVLEKPFGEDLDSAVALNALLAEVGRDAGEQAVFRVDHVLGMATAQNLLALRLADRVLERVWNSAHIERGRDPLGGDARARGPRRLLRQAPGRSRT